MVGLKINQEICLKCGGCVAAYPEVFEFNENDEVVVKTDAKIDLKEVVNMKGVCPVGAIIEY
jgi:ferredoxin